MPIEAVNNKNSNAGLYAASATVLGAGAGAGAAYLTKPFLKDGAPTDTFLKKIDENLLEHLSETEKNVVKDLREIIEKVPKISNVEELKSAISKSEYIKEFFVEEDYETSLENLLDRLSKSVKEDGTSNGFFETVKQDLQAFTEEVEFEHKRDLKNNFRSCWNANKNEFVLDKKVISEEYFEAVKKAAKSVQNKYAMIYGGIAAAVLGIGTCLFCAGRSSAKKSLNEQV